MVCGAVYHCVSPSGGQIGKCWWTFKMCVHLGQYGGGQSGASDESDEGNSRR